MTLHITLRKPYKILLGEDYFWYPVLGNHEVETEEDMLFLNSYLNSEIPNLVNAGPENCERTMYSFILRTHILSFLTNIMTGLQLKALTEIFLIQHIIGCEKI